MSGERLGRALFAMFAVGYVVGLLVQAYDPPIALTILLPFVVGAIVIGYLRRPPS